MFTADERREIAKTLLLAATEIARQAAEVVVHGQGNVHEDWFDIIEGAIAEWRASEASAAAAAAIEAEGAEQFLMPGAFE
jgi:hypothetical protein